MYAGKFNKRKGDDLYVYTKTKLLSESKADRKAKNGSWASSIGETEIRDRHGVTIGYKRTLTFAYPQEGKKKKKKTTWNMHEYRLLYQNGKRKLQVNRNTLFHNMYGVLFSSLLISRFSCRVSLLFFFFFFVLV